MRRRRWLTGAVAGAAALGGAGLAWWRQQAHESPPAALWTLRFEQPGGGELAMAALRGKPLLINFWATWCAPCLRELPEIDRFQRDHAAAGLQVVGLAVDRPEPVREFLAGKSLHFPVALAGLDGSDLVRELGNPQGALPFSVLIDEQGRLRQRKLGETGYDELAGWLHAL